MTQQLAIVNPPVTQATTPACCDVPARIMSYGDAALSSMSMPGAPFVPTLARAAQYQTQVTPTPSLPSPTTLVMPTTDNSMGTVLPPSNPGLTPQSLSRPLPSIVSTTPEIVSQVDSCNAISQWVSDNPLLAGLFLAGLGMMLLGKKENRG